MWFNEKFETFWLEIKNTNVIFWNCRGCFLKNWNRTSKEVSAHYGLNPWEPEVKKLWYSYYLPVFPSFCGGLLKKNVSVQGHFQELQWKNGLKLQFLYKRGLAENFRERTYYTRQNFAFLSPRFLKKKASNQKCLFVFFCVNFSRLPAVSTFCSSIEKWFFFCKKCQLKTDLYKRSQFTFLLSIK